MAKPVQARESMASVDAFDVQRTLVQLIPTLSEAVVITVNGQDVVAVKDAQTAEAVRDNILQEYRETVLSDASTIDRIGFREELKWHTALVAPEKIRTKDEAINILKHGTPKVETYIVKAGDTGWDIAQSYGVTTTDLAKANPNVNLDLLQIGQELVVTFNDPYVHIQSVAQRIVEEGIPFSEKIVEDPNLWPWQYEVIRPGVWGKRRLVLREYWEDGKVVKTEVLENKVLSAPQMQLAKRGTKQIPEMGTGSLVFPVVGPITSYFGPRWGRFHFAIDIAAPVGTPVLAADSGMVVFVGWSGNYGKLIKIDHGGGKMVTWYAHLSGFNVQVGDTVHKGDVIGYVGNTGYSTGPHLHYEIHVNGKPVDPLSYYP